MISKNQIKQLQSLKLKKYRDVNKLFLVEGVKTVKELFEQRPGLVHELYGTPDFIEDSKKILIKNRIKFTEVSEKELGQISLQSSPNKVVAICRYFEEKPLNFDFNANFSLYLDDIRDPGNLGTIIRLADWYGVSAIYCSPESCDLYNPKVIQSTMGAFLRVNVNYITLNELLKTNAGINVYGAVLEGKDIYNEKLSGGLIVVGNEANGISDENFRLLNRFITIPSHKQNGTESLNAAMAASIITSEFFRQLRTT